MDTLWSNIFKARQKKDEEITSTLENIPIFEGLGKRELHQIVRILHSRQYRSGEKIFAQGGPAIGMYIIVTGTVQIINEPSGEVLAELRDGEFFGELALLDNSPRSAAAVAATPCRMLGFFQSDLLGLTQRNPKLGIKIVSRLARIIGERLKQTNEMVHSLRSELKRTQEFLDDCTSEIEECGRPDLKEDLRPHV